MDIHDPIQAASVVVFALVGITIVIAALPKDMPAGKLWVFLVGASAGFATLTVHHLLIFSVVAIVALPFQAKALTGAGALKVFAVFGSAALLASTAYFDELPTSHGLSEQLVVLAVATCSVYACDADADSRRVLMLGLLTTCTVGGAVAVAQVLHVAPQHIAQFATAETGRPSGLQPEPDWVGLFGFVGTVIAWREVRNGGWRTLFVLVNLAALFLSEARAAIVALAVTVALTVLLRPFHSRPAETRGNAAGPLIAIAVVATVFYFALPAPVHRIESRLGAVIGTGTADSSLISRQEEQQNGIELAEEAPSTGYGLSAAGRASYAGIDYGAIQPGARSETTISDWLLGMWIDGKYLSIPVIVLLIGFGFVRLGTTQGQLLVGVLIGNLFSNATFFPITWLLLALCLMETRAPAADGPKPVEDPGHWTEQWPIRPPRYQPLGRGFQQYARRAR